jgi:hypothetical protein
MNDMTTTAESPRDGAPYGTTAPIAIALSKPVEVIDRTVTTVTLTPPTGRHLMKAGSIMRFINNDAGGETALEVNPDGMGRLIAACGNLTLRGVEMMAAADFMACSVALMGFLAPTPAPEATSSNAISTSQGSGATSTS